MGCLTRFHLERSVRRMLPSSSASPKHATRCTPKPALWLGVQEGLLAAKEAFHAGRTDEAEKMLHTVLEFAPLEPKAWAWLGRVAQLKGDETEGLVYLKKAEALIRNQHEITVHTPISRQLAMLLWQQGEKGQAQAMLIALLEQSPEDATLLLLSKQWGQAVCR